MTDIRSRWDNAQKIEPTLHLNESFDAGYRDYEKTYGQYFKYTGGSFDLNGRSVLEIGPAHFPALSYCCNFSVGYVLDPMASDFMLRSIAGKNINHIQQPAEDIELPLVDEIWLFNLLTHVIDPDKIIKKCKRAARIIRFFEPINQGIDATHLHDFTFEYFRRHFGKCTTHYPTNTRAVNFHQHEAAYGVFENDYPDEITAPKLNDTTIQWEAPTIQGDGNKFSFKKIQKVCISLSGSTDRRHFMRAEFLKAGIDVLFLSAVDGKKVVVPELCKKPAPVFACMQSHIAAIRYAKEKKLPAICVFEDDVVFCDDFKERIEYLESLMGFSFDIFCLGGHFDNATEKGTPTQWKYVHRITRMGGTYGYIFKSKVYDFILRNATYEYGADEFYSRFVYHRFFAYAFVPFLVGCRVCKSEISGNVWEYENIGWTYQQKTMRLKDEK